MTRLRDRAVAVALDGGAVLVLRRHQHGKDYCVLPGGGVEPGEDPRDACVRELLEETGLTGVADRHLWTLEHPDRVAHYFLVSVLPGTMSVGGPEALLQSDQNRYTPHWLSLRELDAENVQPETVRTLVRRLAATGPGRAGDDTRGPSAGTPAPTPGP